MKSDLLLPFIVYVYTLAKIVHGQIPPSPPPFSWETIPLFIHVDNHSGPFNETAAKYIASFPLATVEKQQGQNKSNPVCSLTEPCEEDKIIAALQQIRSYSKDVRTLFYLNSEINFPNFNLSTNFLGKNEKYLLHDDKTGKLVYLGDCHANGPNYTIFDPSYNQTRQFWVNTVKYAMTKYPGVVDGIFADKASTFNTSHNLKCVNFTDQHRKDFQNGFILMLQEAMEMVNKHSNGRGIIMCNGADIDKLNGRMFENFTTYDAAIIPPGNTLPVLMQEGGIRVSEVHEDKCSFFSRTYNSSLAAYLIGAVEYSYYMCSQHWDLRNGSGFDNVWVNPDFSKELGKPMGNATIDNGVYYREFAHGVKVWLDMEWQYPCIKWNDGSITGSPQNCKKYTDY